MSLDQPTATLLVGLVTAGVTISSWLAVHYFTRRREIESLNVQHQKEVDARKYAEEQEITRLPYHRRVACHGSVPTRTSRGRVLEEDYSPYTIVTYLA
jgi:hypothetical protein